LARQELEEHDGDGDFDEWDRHIFFKWWFNALAKASCPFTIPLLLLLLSKDNHHGPPIPRFLILSSRTISFATNSLVLFKLSIAAILSTVACKCSRKPGCATISLKARNIGTLLGVTSARLVIVKKFHRSNSLTKSLLVMIC
jgi:hypothetical protein